jgi:hypothetical protein
MVAAPVEAPAMVAAPVEAPAMVAAPVEAPAMVPAPLEASPASGPLAPAAEVVVAAPPMARKHVSAADVVAPVVPAAAPRSTPSIASAARAWLAEIRGDAASRVATPAHGVKGAGAALDAAAGAALDAGAGAALDTGAGAALHTAAAQPPPPSLASAPIALTAAQERAEVVRALASERAELEAPVTAALEEPTTDGTAMVEDASPWALDWHAPSSSEIESMLSNVVEETTVDRAQPLESPWVASSGPAGVEAAALPPGIEGLEPAGAQALSAVDVEVSPPLGVQTAPPVEVESLLRGVADPEPRGPEPFAAGAVAAVAAMTEPAVAPKTSPPALPGGAVHPPAGPAGNAAARTAGRGRIEIEAIPPAWEETTTEIELPDGEGGVNDLVLAVIPDAPAPAPAGPTPRARRSPVSWLFSKLRGLVARR